MIFAAIIWIFNFVTLSSAIKSIKYESLSLGSYDSNDISVIMENITEPWSTTQRTCSVRWVRVGGRGLRGRREGG